MTEQAPRMIKSFGGIVNYLPNFSLFIIFVLGALGLPEQQDL